MLGSAFWDAKDASKADNEKRAKLRYQLKVKKVAQQGGAMSSLASKTPIQEIVFV